MIASFAVLALLAAASASSAPDTSDCRPQSPVSRSSDGKIENVDVRDPMNFVEIVERRVDGTSVLLLGPPDSATHGKKNRNPKAWRVKEKPSPEVDVRSRIHVWFDRSKIRHLPPGTTELMVRGNVIGADGTAREMPIMGYAEVGKEARTVAARIRSSTELVALLNEFQRVHCQVRAELDQVRRSAEQKSTNAVTISSLRTAINRLERTMAEERLVRDSVFAAAQEPTTAAQSDSLAQQTSQMENSRAAVLRRLSRYGIQYDSLAEQLRDEQAKEGYKAAVSRNFVFRARSQLLNNRDVLAVALTRLVDEDDRVLATVLGRSAGRDPAILSRQAKTIRDVWYPALELSSGTDSVDLAKWLPLIEHIQNGLAQIGSLANSGTANGSFDDQFVGMLKDTHFLVRQTGARVGDRILLEVSNGDRETDLPRTFPLLLEVRRFGLVPQLTDAFLLVNRVGVGATTSETRIDTARARFARRNVPGDSTFTLPEDVAFQPVPSITFGWAYHRRYAAEGESKLRVDIVRWLDPGFGLNVAFPQFKSTRYRIVRDSASSVTVEPLPSTGQNVQLAVGAVGSLFDNAVVLSFGRHLTADRKPWYFGLGFSFVRVIEGVVSK